MGGLLVGLVFDNGSLEGFEELLHLLDNDSQSVSVDGGSDFHERSDWVIFANFRKVN